MSRIFLIRHGQSAWNLENRFTGAVDIALTNKGREEAKKASEMLASSTIDLAFCSNLIRAQETAVIALASQAKACQRVENGHFFHGTLPMVIDSRLNERSYGALQGMNKDQARAEYGDSQVQIWRRSYANRPPKGESLADTAIRVSDFVNDKLLTYLNQGMNVAIFAHGNSIRALHMLFLEIDSETIMQFEVATGQILTYEFSEEKFIKVEYE